MQSVVRYVLFDYLLVFVIALVVAAALLLFVGAMLDLPPDIGAAEILLMLPYLAPEAIRNAMQTAALFAACCVFGRLAGSNELLALSSLGISPFKVIRPVLLVATLLSLTCVWLYDIGEYWGQKGIRQVVVDSAEAIAYRFLRTKHSYSKGHVALNVKGVVGKKLIRPTLIMETPDQPEPVTISAEEGELRTLSRERGLSIVMRHGTVYIGDVASMAFPDAMEQVVSLGEAGGKSRWPPVHRSLANLQDDLADQRAVVAGLERAPRLSPADWMATAAPAALSASTSALETERQHMHWIETQINRRWTNGFFCLAFVTIGIPVAMRVRSRDYLTSFFACFVPVVLLNHPLHNFCIKLAESGRAPSVLPWAGDLLLILLGAVLLSRSLRH
jgi:lipopolysaccharide export system permease protein